MEKYVVKSVEERLKEWRLAENAAVEAEKAVEAIGQAAADPAAGELFRTAKRLRDDADRQFSAIVRGISMDELQRSDSGGDMSNATPASSQQSSQTH